MSADFPAVVGDASATGPHPAAPGPNSAGPDADPSGSHTTPAAAGDQGTPHPVPQTPPAPSGDQRPPRPDADPRTERPHPLTPFIRGWVVLIAVVIGVVRELRPDGTDGWTLPRGEFLLAGAGFVLLAALFAGAAGVVSWWTTRFVIDETELRIETGALFHTSQRIAFERVQAIDVVQPFAARLVGLAELQIDVGADGATKVRYLSLSRAYELRDYLLERARGFRTAVVAGDQVTWALEDLSARDEVLVRIQPQTLILAAVTSHEFWTITLGGVVSAGVAVALGNPVFVLAIAVPTLSMLVGLVSRRVVAQFNYTLSRRPAGLRISRGLTSLTSQSLPGRRIQAVQISQSLLWRRLGLFRVDVEVIGWGALTTDESDSGVNTILLPAGTADDVRTALTALWPGVDVDLIGLRPSPSSARWLHPVSAPFLGWGFDDDIVVTRHGWLVRRQQVVPLARTQSIRITQGPLERTLKLANLEFHTGGMQIGTTARAVAAADASAALPRLLELARASRPHDVAEPPSAARRADHAEETISSTE